MRVSTTNTTTTFQFTPTILNTLPEAEHTDHSDSDENTETANINMEGGSLTPSPPNPQLELISEEPITTPPPRRRRRPNEDEKTDHNEKTNPTIIKEGDDGWVTNQRTPRGGLSPDGGGTHHPPKSVVQAGGARNYPRSSRAPPSNSTMRTGTGTGTGKTPSCTKSTNVEQHRRESSRLQNAPKSGNTPQNNSGVDDIIIILSSSSSSSSCSPHYFRKEQEEIPDSDVTANNISAHNYNNNNNKAYLAAGTKAVNTNMDDDSLGLGSAAGGSPLRDGESQQPQSREPEGTVPTHRVGQSRRFSDDLSAAIQKELDEERGTATEAASNGGDTARSTTPSSPLEGLKEISISHITEIYENETDDVSEPSTSPPVGPVTPSQSGLKPRQLLPDEEVEDRVVPLKQPAQPTRRESMEQEAIESSSWNHHHQPMNDDSFDGGSAPNAPQKSEQSSVRPPSVTDMAPPESDLSVFSIHSGYAMHDPNGNMNGLQPRIVPGTMVQSPAAYSHPYANNIPSHIQPHHQAPLPSLQTQHSIGSNGYSQHPHHFAPSAHHQHHAPAAAAYPSVIMAPPHQHHQVGKRKVHFRLVEDIPTPSTLRKHSNLRASFLSFRRNSSRNSLLTPSTQPVDEELPSSSHQEIDRGRVTVSWYEGTTTLELMEHVRNAVIRKVGLQQGTIKLAELRILDESSDPPEEIVLSPYIPNGSRLLLRFTTRDAGGDMTPPHSSYYGRQNSYLGGAPDSPSAAPSPHHSSSLLDLEGLGLNPNQLALLGARLKGLQMPIRDDDDDDDDRNNHRDDSRRRDRHRKKSSSPSKTGTPSKKSARMAADKRSKSDRDRSTDEAILQQAMAAAASTNHPDQNKNEEDEEDAGSSDKDKDSKDDESSVFEMQSLHPDDRIQKSLQNITELLLLERQKAARGVYPKQEKRQVVFTLANYFVLFLSLIAISAEIQARAPEWNAAIERHLNSVKNCSKDQDALFECVSNGDFSGLVASVVLWISRSAATKRIFLFGFDSPRKLWTVVYESLVTAFCWGFSYMFIRRGMNPDTNRNFLQKYWKDAVYGSLAGFNAAFMKHVLKNLIPQEAIEDALQERQLRILSWLPSLSH